MLASYRNLPRLWSSVASSYSFDVAVLNEGLRSVVAPAASLRSHIRRAAMASVQSVELQTPRALGLKMTVELTVYDNGMISI
jgi:hypothetical protein